MKIKNTNVESTPFIYLEITDNSGKSLHELRQYHTVSAGMYGFQVCQQEWHIKEDSDTDYNYSEWKSGGCGYCKASAGFEVFCRDLGVNVGGGSVSYYLRKYNLGGNFYRCTIEQLKEAVK